MRLIDKSIQGLVQVFDVTPAANSHQGQQPCVMKSIQSHGGVQKAAHLRQCVVQNVRQPVAASDQALGGVEPGVLGWMPGT